MIIKRNHNRADIVCGECGVMFTVPHYRSGKAKYCGKICAGSAQAKKYLNKTQKPWAAKNLDGHRHKSTSRFTQGHASWNKGVKSIHLSPESEFKAGRDSEKELPVGSVTVRNDRNGNPRAFIKTHSGWEARARVIYAKKNGGIDAEKVIHHIDGDTLNDRPQNLAALTRSEHIAEHRDQLREPAPTQEVLL